MNMKKMSITEDSAEPTTHTTEESCSGRTSRFDCPLNIQNKNTNMTSSRVVLSTLEHWSELRGMWTLRTAIPRDLLFKDINNGFYRRTRQWIIVPTPFDHFPEFI